MTSIPQTWSDGLFDGQRAIVTGAASGIGRSVAQQLAGLGAHVIAVDLAEEGLADLEVAETLVGDLTDERFRAEIVRSGQDIDHLVNVAGFQKLVTAEAASTSDWDILFDVNVKAPFFLTRDLEPYLRDRGRVVFFSSVAARWGQTPETVIYAAAKTAVLSITRSYAHLFGPRGICVNAILPGTTNTPMQDMVINEIAARHGVDPQALEAKRLAVVPLARIAAPEEIAAAVIWLLSPAGAYVTGQGIAVDGGWTMI